MKEINQICISRLDKMGDMILSLPAIKTIKMTNPSTHICVLASQNNSKVLKGISYIDKIIEINTSSDLSALFNNMLKLRKLNFDFYINLSPTLLSYYFCFFSNAKNKATLVFLSRYKKSIFSKLFTRLFSKIFCHYVHTIDRYSKLKNNEAIHQTKMIFDLIKICQIPFDSDTEIDIALPDSKLSLIPLNKVLITIHLSERWINQYYTEENFLDLVLHLPKEKYIYVLTTDNSTKNKFNKIYNRFKIIDNNSFISIKKLRDNVTILDKLSYKNWINVIYSSNQIITPESGCTHISAACKVPVIVIYNSNNMPEAIYKEYHPWKSQHIKLVFGDKKINEKIINNLA